MDFQTTDIVKALSERGFFITYKDNGDFVSMGFPFKRHEDNEIYGYILNNSKYYAKQSEIFDIVTIIDIELTSKFAGRARELLEKQKCNAAFGEFSSFDEIKPKELAKNIIVDNYSRKSIFSIIKNILK